MDGRIARQNESLSYSLARSAGHRHRAATSAPLCLTSNPKIGDLGRHLQARIVQGADHGFHEVKEIEARRVIEAD